MKRLGHRAGLLALCVASFASRVESQPPDRAAPERWLVLPVVIAGDPETDVETLHGPAESVRQALAVRGVSAWRPDRAAERFEVIGSAPAPEVTQSDIDRWVERSRSAVKHLARADYKSARRDLRAAQQVADRAAEELNREGDRAQQVLDTCLFMVRAYVETRNDAEARRQARECRYLVPKVEASAFRHTPEVLDLLAEVDREIASEAPAQLTVRSQPGDCRVRINGVELGRTPLREVELPVGTYRLQVECHPDRRGRIHRVGVESGPQSITVDVAIDDAVRTRPVLSLQYLDPPLDSDETMALRMADARAVAGVLDAPGVLVLTAPTPDRVRVDLDAPRMPPASVWLPLSQGVLSNEDAARGIEALFDGRSVDFTEGHPVSQASWQAETQARPTVAANAQLPSDANPARRTAHLGARPRAQRIAGGSLLGAGGATLGVAIGLHFRRQTLGNQFERNPSSLGAAQDWRNARVGVYTSAAVGGSAMVSSLPLLLPKRARAPWWAWTLGAAGVGLTAYAIYEGVTMTRCPDPYIGNASAVSDCVARGQEAGRVAIALGWAAPLLTVPLVYLLRPLRMEASVAASPEGAFLSVGRSF